MLGSQRSPRISLGQVLHDLVRVDGIEAALGVNIDRVEDQDIGRGLESAIPIDEDRGAIRARSPKIGFEKGKVFAGAHSEFENARTRRGVASENLDELPPVVSLGHLDVLIHTLVGIEISHGLLQLDRLRLQFGWQPEVFLHQREYLALQRMPPSDRHYRRRFRAIASGFSGLENHRPRLF
jgi:hypothetical protein